MHTTNAHPVGEYSQYTCLKGQPQIWERDYSSTCYQHKYSTGFALHVLLTAMHTVYGFMQPSQLRYHFVEVVSQIYTAIKQIQSVALGPVFPVRI